MSWMVTVKWEGRIHLRQGDESMLCLCTVSVEEPLFAHYTPVYGRHHGVTLLKTGIPLRDAADAGFRRYN